MQSSAVQPVLPPLFQHASSSLHRWARRPLATWLSRVHRWQWLGAEDLQIQSAEQTIGDTRSASVLVEAPAAVAAVVFVLVLERQASVIVEPSAAAAVLD